MNTRIVIAVIILVWAAIVAVFGLRLFSPQTQVIPRSDNIDISSYASNPNAEVRLIVQGPVVANENFRSGMITVSSSSRSVTGYKTYTNEVADSAILGNNQEAFTQFINALKTTGFGQVRASNQKEVQSSCPTGYRYTYELRDGGNVVYSTWATSCTNARHTYGGNAAQTNQLFRVQIPGLSQSPNYAALLQ